MVLIRLLNGFDMLRLSNFVNQDEFFQIFTKIQELKITLLNFIK